MRASPAIKMTAVVAFAAVITTRKTTQLLPAHTKEATKRSRTPPKRTKPKPVFLDQHNKTCPTVFHIQLQATEHTPLLLHSVDHDHGSNASIMKDLIVCRVPKVGSTMLRTLANSIKNQYRGKRVFHTAGDRTMTLDQFQYLMYHSSAHQKDQANRSLARIMFVRHPVMRILSGTLHMEAFPFLFRKIPGISFPTESGRKRSLTPEEFAAFATHPNGLTRDYKPNCTLGVGEEFKMDDREEKSLVARGPHHLRVSTNGFIQHWAPPQHCRCGIFDCGIQYIIFPIERIPSIQQVIKDHLSPNHNPSWMPPPSKRINALANSSSIYTRYLENATLLEFLNDVTKIEQEYFGYLPLTLEHARTGTVALFTDSV